MLLSTGAKENQPYTFSQNKLVMRKCGFCGSDKCKTSYQTFGGAVGQGLDSRLMVHHMLLTVGFY